MLVCGEQHRFEFYLEGTQPKGTCSRGPGLLLPKLSLLLEKSASDTKAAAPVKKGPAVAPRQTPGVEVLTPMPEAPR
jgi:hypothetical protein